MRELLIGCGNQRKKLIRHGETPADWQNLTTLDIDPEVNPDIVHDLNVLPYPFEDNTFDEIHAYQVLEHLGRQGDWKFFLDQFAELWRVLKPEGLLCAMVPMWDSPWAWGDPGHTRVITQGSLAFLDQDIYAENVGKTPMTDYRPWYKAHFKTVAVHEDENHFGFVLRAIK